MKEFKNIHYGAQTLDEKDIYNVKKTLKSNLITQGPQIKLFEDKIASYTGSKFCSVVNNGTSALFLAVKALKLKQKDIVITSPITFLATANSIVYNNAIPDFVDIDEKDYNIDLNILEDKIKFYRKKK